MRILVTGSAGLIGHVLLELLSDSGHEALGYDIVAPIGDPARGDIRDFAHLSRLADSVDGIIHLAAISRVKHAEADPATCHAVNVEGTRNVLTAAARASARPWVLLASSREVYGNPLRIPVHEDDVINPLNTYGRSKALSEKLALEARRDGLRVGVVRLANVYGHVNDHADRAVPAFCRAAVMRTPIRVEGNGYQYDFTHVDDVVTGILTIAAMLHDDTIALPIVHLVSGKATSLERLAELAWLAGDRYSEIRHESNFHYNVSCFVGDPSRAHRLLNWRTTIPIDRGIRNLVRDMKLKYE